MTVIEVGEDLTTLDVALEGLPNSPAVFVLWPKSGEPYLSKTALLRRRLLRLLRERDKPSRLLNLRHTVARIEYQLTGSTLESGMVQYGQARRLFPENSLEVLRLRMPPYVKIILTNEFPRSHITTHLARTGLHFVTLDAAMLAEILLARQLVIEGEPRVEDQVQAHAERRRNRQADRMPRAGVEGEDEGQGMDEVRRVAQQTAALDERLAHEWNVELREVANAAMHELGGLAARPAGKVAALQ